MNFRLKPSYVIPSMVETLFQAPNKEPGIDYLYNDVLKMFELLAELVVEDQLREILRFQLRMFESFVVRFVFADFAQFVEIILDSNPFLNQL